MQVVFVRHGRSHYASRMRATSRPTIVLLILLAMSVLPVACRSNLTPVGDSTLAVPTEPTAVAAAPATATAPPLPSPLPTAADPATATATLTAAPTPAPDPLYPYTIAGMRARTFTGGQIGLRDLLEDNGRYRRYAMDYPSDGLTVTGTLNVPTGDGPFPVVVLLHGYFEREQYWPGADTWQAADFFARNGYIAIAPDFRSWGGSDTGVSLFHMGLVADTLNLISSLPSLPAADPDRVALWGHSMGGGIATKVLVIDDRPLAAVLYAPNSPDDADLIGRWGPGCLPGQSETAGDTCNPAEVIPADLPPDLLRAYLSAAADPAYLTQVAPLYHLTAVAAPVQIHSGTADGAFLAETPPEWSSKLFDALQAAGKEVTLFTYPDQGHFFQPAEWARLMERSLAFFDPLLKP